MASMESDSIPALVRKIYVICLVIFLISGTGCSAGYIFHAASGQFSLLAGSVKIEEALKSDSLDDEKKSKLRLVSEIKKFGEDRLGLKKTNCYRDVYLRSERPPIYVISACPKDSLKIKTWWFPIVGKMPYLGFFTMDRAFKKKGKLSGQGMDVNIGVADAYSTLGWFDDPVTLNLLNDSRVNLAEIILHEMTHTTLYIKGRGAFNEGLANLIGKAGAVEFFRMKYGSNHPYTVEACNILADELMFSGFINSLIQALKKVYDSDLSYEKKLEEREKTFSFYLKKHNKLLNEYRTGRFKNFGKNRLNNAYILSVELYTRDFPEFYRMLEQRSNSIAGLLNDLGDKNGRL